jgi:hypothetical protein
VQIYSGKVTVSVFWDSEGILLVGFLERVLQSFQSGMFRYSRKWNYEFEDFGYKENELSLPPS